MNDAVQNVLLQYGLGGALSVLLFAAVVFLFKLYVKEKDGRLEDAKQVTERVLTALLAANAVQSTSVSAFQELKRVVETAVTMKGSRNE